MAGLLVYGRLHRRGDRLGVVLAVAHRLLVDVRTRSEVEADRSPDAIHIQVDELPHRYHELKQTQQLIFVCQAGDRSAAAAEFMTSIGGHDIYTVNGGMSAWSGRRASGPIEPKNRT